MRLSPLLLTTLLLGACATLTTPAGTGPRPAGVTLAGRVLMNGGTYSLQAPNATPTPLEPEVQADDIATVEVWVQSTTAPYPGQSPGACLGPNGAYATLAPTWGPTVAPTAFPTVLYTAPTTAPTSLVSWMPTSLPTFFQTSYPTAYPTYLYTTVPTSYPTTLFTTDPLDPGPTPLPTYLPTSYPTSYPTAYQTLAPTAFPSYVATSFPTTVPSYVATSFPTTVPTYLPTSFETVYPTLGPTFLPTVLPTVHPTPSTSPPADAVLAQQVPGTRSPLTYAVSGLALDRYHRVVLRALGYSGQPISCPGLSQATFDTFAVNGAYPTTISRDIKLALYQGPTYFGEAVLGFDIRPGGIASPQGAPQVGDVSRACASPVTPARFSPGPIVDPVLVAGTGNYSGLWILKDRSDVTGCTPLTGTRQCAYFDGRMSELDVYACP